MNTLEALISILNEGNDVTLKANSNCHNDLKKIAEDYSKLLEAVALFSKSNWNNAQITHFDQLQKSVQKVRQHEAVNVFDLNSIAKQRRKFGEKL